MSFGLVTESLNKPRILGVALRPLQRLKPFSASSIGMVSFHSNSFEVYCTFDYAEEA